MPIPEGGLSRKGDDRPSDEAETPEIDFLQMAEELPLGNAIGQPFVRSSVPVARGPVGKFRRTIPGAPSQGNLSYTVIPTDPEQARQVAFETVSSLVAGEKISPWNTAAITAELASMVDSPQAAYVLRTPEIIDDWQATVWTNTMGSLTVGLEDLDAGLGNVDYVNKPMVADFFKEYDSTFSAQERQFIVQMLASMPDANTILRDSDVRPEGTGLWADFKLGWRTITRAPEAIRLVVNDPRDQMLAEMHQWLKDNPLDSLEDRSDFMLFFMDRAGTSIEEVQANAQGFFALAEASVALPFTTFGNEYNDWFHRAADPNSFANRQNLSIGQNIAIGTGVNPADEWYKSASGFIDGVVGIVADPLNLAYGIGNGIRNAAKVPRAVSVSKTQAFTDAFRLFGGGRQMNLPVFDRGIISRFSYAAFSRDVDQLVKTPRVRRLSERLSRMSSESAIIEMMPDWAESAKLVRWIAETDDPRIIREIMKVGMTHPEIATDKAPMLAAHTAAGLSNATKRHSALVTEWLDDGGSLGGLSSIDEVQDYLVRVPGTEDLDDPFLFIRSSELVGDDSIKFAVSTLGTEGRKPLDLQKNIDEFASYLHGAGLADDAGLVVDGTPISRLSPSAQTKSADFVQAKGRDFGSFMGEMVATPSGRAMLIEGTDGGATGAKSLDDLRDSYRALSEAKRQWTDIHTKMDPNLWVIKDTGLQMPTQFRKFRLKISTQSNAGWMRQARRAGFRITHRLPTNISLVEGGEGARQLRNWVKALGGNDDLANKWSDAFRAGNAGTRKDIILEAMQEVGQEIKNPMLRDGVLTFGSKQGNYTYFFDRAGRELGLAADGTISPMTLSHFSDNFAMPNAKKLLRSMKRYGNAKILPGTRRGILPGTRKVRRDLAENLQRKITRVGGPENIPKQDLYAMAYADILGGEYGRATGMGYVAKVAGLARDAYGFVHNQFVIAQLAFRPIAWSTRVLLEETMRADLFSLPSVWRNPHDWISHIAEASAIRRLPAELAAQGEVAEGLINRIFLSGKLDLGEAKRIIPNIEALLADAGIAVGDTNRVRAFVSTYVGKELIGRGTTEGTIGRRGNITVRAALRRRHLRNTFEKMDTEGLGEAFRWDVGGQEIAQRSLYQPYVKEAEAATIPLHYGLEGMTPRGLHTYGRAYGRQIYQMNRDPIVSTYGYNRAIARSLAGETTYDGQKLVASDQWPRIRHIVEKQLTGDGKVGLSEVEKADWYLTRIDEIVETLFGSTGLAGDDLTEKVRILRELKNGGTTNVTSGGVEHALNSSASNYEGFVEAMANFTEGAYGDGRMLPRTISAFVDPRFGQRETSNIYRRFTDWSMMKFGEEATQKLNRQPAYVHIRGRNYRYYRDLGWDVETAQKAAAERSAELTNFIFFDNNNIPQFLKDMNGVIPFFSAMWEVGSTWVYKIPSQNVMPVGYAQLGRRVERTIRGLRATGLVEYDAESNMMSLNVDREMLNANGPIAAAFGRTLFEYIRLPITLLEHLGGIGNLITDQEYEKSDFGAWSRDGFSIGVGNPLDPSSHGLMAINQFSLGASPVLQLPVSMAANAVFAQSDERMDTEGESVAEFLVANPELDIGTLLRANQEAFIDANGEEVFNRAMNYDWDLDTLKMPESLRIPNTSTWEMLVNNLVFPFGKMESVGQVLTSPSPSAMNYVWRGLLQKYGGEGGDEIAGMLFGQMAEYSMAAEVLTQIQMIEASEGTVSLSLRLATEVEKLVETAKLQIAFDEDNTPYVLNPEGDAAIRAQALFDQIARINTDIMKRASDNAAGAQLMRGVMGQLGPVTPRMWTQEQKQIADYWSSRELALEAKVTGSFNFGELLTNASEINTFADMERLGAISQAWLNDPTGDEAKVWMAEQMPALLVFAQGKTFWGPAGPPPEITRFDEWVEQIESGDRKPFAPEVFMARYQRTGIGIDREIAIINEYGNDPDSAALDILRDYNAYYDLIDDFDRRYDALEFLDAYLYDGKYNDYRNTDLDDLTFYQLFTERARDTREEIDTLNDLLARTDLEPDERRRMLGIISSTQREYDNAIRELNNLDNADKFSNPREQILNRYWELSNEFYEDRNELFDQLGDVPDKTERSIVFEAVRALSDEWYNRPNTVEGWDGDTIPVPAPEVRSWNARPQNEKQERIMNMIGKKPEWLSQFESEILVSESAEFANVLPLTPSQRAIYDQAALRKWEIRKAWAANPEAFTKSARDKMVSEVEDQLDQLLAESGRIGELQYRQTVPFMRLATVDMLPPSLLGIVPMLNQILEELRLNEKSPTTNDGYVRMMQLRVWLESNYFESNPQARQDVMMLGSTMFGETVPTAVYAKLFQGDFYGELG